MEDAVRFIMKFCIVNTMTKTRYPNLLAHLTELCLSNVDQSQCHCRDYYSYDYRSTNVREALPTHYGKRNQLRSIPGLLMVWRSRFLPNLNLFLWKQKRYVRNRWIKWLTFRLFGHFIQVLLLLIESKPFGNLDERLLCYSASGKRDDEKRHTIVSNHPKSDSDVPAAIHNVGKAILVCEAEPVVVNTLNIVVDCWKVAFFDEYNGR